MVQPPARRKVLLIGWDGADWEHINPLLEEGLLPTLEALINRGVMGNLATLQPVLSPMLWNSVATGKFADKHGIHGFIEPDPVNGGARPYTSTSRKTKALWNILTQSGLKSNVVGWWASHPAEPINGVVVTNAFGGVNFHPDKGWQVPAGAVHPAEKGPLLAPFKVFPSELTEAHILPFIPQAARIDQQKNPSLRSFTKILSDNATIHAAATAIMECEPWDFMAVYYDGIDHFSHAFMPFHPPKLDWVKEEDFELFQGVIRGAYRFHDLMLARLLQLAGPETTVILCSDHGFESGAQRPRGVPREPAGPAAWHRQYGIFVMAGEGIKQDERISGASLIDLAPTVLSLFGLPVGQDMDGRPLLEAFKIAPPVATIPSWDAVPGDCGMHAAGQGINRDQAQELMQQFAALGYIEDLGADKEKQAESAGIEAKYNLASTLLWQGKSDEALPLLEDITRRRPWEDRFLIQLVNAYFQAGYLRQAERVLSAAYDFEEVRNPSLLLLWARLKLALGDAAAGLAALQAASQLSPGKALVHTHLGDTYVQLGRWTDARTAYERAIDIDPEDAFAYQGLSNAFRRQGDMGKTADAAMRALGLLHRLPQAHFNLGVALARSAELDKARVAFETALRFQPGFFNAHRYLGAIHGVLPGGMEKARFHRQEARRLRGRRGAAGRKGHARRDMIFDLPDIPGRQERKAMVLRERPDPKPVEEWSGKTFVLVSGLPRSGTSLMMQLLQAGGLEPMTDGERMADVDNPRGYYEWEAIKQVAACPEILDDAAITGKAIKCISMLLPKLPPQHRYKVIFMVRPLEEVVASQREMTARLGTRGAALDAEQLARGLHAHRDDTLQWLARTPHMEHLEVSYPALVRDPAPCIARLAAFLGADRLPQVEWMQTAVNPILYRKRGVKGTLADGPITAAR